MKGKMQKEYDITQRLSTCSVAVPARPDSSRASAAASASFAAVLSAPSQRNHALSRPLLTGSPYSSCVARSTIAGVETFQAAASPAAGADLFLRLQIFSR